MCLSEVKTTFHAWPHVCQCLSMACTFAISAMFIATPAPADSRGEDLALWLNARGEQLWGKPPQRCDDLTFARRVYLDLLGRVPSVAEVQDFESLPAARRRILVDQIVFGEGQRARDYRRLASVQLARQWRQVLMPTSSTATASAANSLERWLAGEFEQRVAYDDLMKKLVGFEPDSAAPQYFQAIGGLPENYAGQISRALLGVRIECAQCHDHPFSDWKQQDFWGLAAFYADVSRSDLNTTQAVNFGPPVKIQFEGKEYPAKYLWSGEPLRGLSEPRAALGDWLTSSQNPQFAATAVNRFWQNLVGRGMYWDVENLDQAKASEREFLDEFGQRFAELDFQVDQLIAAICKSNWYSSVSSAEPLNAQFYRPLKSVSPEQIFDSLEQALQLPISRIDANSPRYSGQGTQLMSRLTEAIGNSPEDYSAGIPQALLLMNGQMTADAIDIDRSRLLRSVVDSPFFNEQDRIAVLYLAILTRRPTTEELAALQAFLESQSDETRRRAMGEILWALINSPEFVLCR